MCIRIHVFLFVFVCMCLYASTCFYEYCTVCACIRDINNWHFSRPIIGGWQERIIDYSDSPTGSEMNTLLLSNAVEIFCTLNIARWQTANNAWHKTRNRFIWKFKKTLFCVCSDMAVCFGLNHCCRIIYFCINWLFFPFHFWSKYVILITQNYNIREDCCVDVSGFQIRQSFDVASLFLKRRDTASIVWE